MTVNRVKKNILFVIESLVGAGAEKSLITLLSLLDYTDYHVDLVLFTHGELLEDMVPEEVNILDPFKYSQYTSLNLKKSILFSIKKFEMKMLYSRLKYSLKIRLKKYNNPQKARIFWESASSVIEKNPKNYDIAISYAQGIPTFYVAEKVKAKRKFSWVNVSYRLNEKERNFQNNFYKKYNKIIAVSKSTKEIFLETFPFYLKKMEVIQDINNPSVILGMSKQGYGYSDDFNGIRILTIGRLAYQKGYDIALKTCKKLKDNGIDFRWYVLGKGPLEEEIKKYITENNLTEYFVLLGVDENPYPFIKNCDIYVQTSRFEGFGLAIAEARMLNKPIVTTNFDAVYSQMVDGQNGLVVDMNEDAVFNGICKLLNDKGLRKDITNYLQQEKKGNIEEIEKFYSLIT